MNSKWLQNLNIRHYTTKLLEEKRGKTFSDINHTNVFLGQSPKAIEIKAKINKWDLVKFTSFCTAKETVNKMNRCPPRITSIIIELLAFLINIKVKTLKLYLGQLKNMSSIIM